MNLNLATKLDTIYRQNNAALTVEDVDLVTDTDDYGQYRAKGGLLPSGIAYAIVKLTIKGREESCPE